jgi:hypothetical protein
MLSTLLMMRDDAAFEPGQDWVHVLGVSTPKWAVMLSAVQRALRVHNPKLRISFDSSSPFQTGGRYEEVAVCPDFTSDSRSWNMSTVLAPQSRLHVHPDPAKPFPYPQSPIGARLKLHHLSVRGGKWNQRQFDSVSNMLLTNHNVWVYLDAMKRANDFAAGRDKQHVPPLFLDCIDLIEEAFVSHDWPAFIKRNGPNLDAAAPSEYT